MPSNHCLCPKPNLTPWLLRSGTVPRHQVRPVAAAGCLTQEEYESGVDYQQDYELANQTHHSRPSYENLRTDGGKARDFDLKDNQVQASKNIQIIKSLIDEKEKLFEEYTESRGRRRSKGLIKTLNLIFERQLTVSRVKILTRMSFELIEKRSKEVAIVINNYYRN